MTPHRIALPLVGLVLAFSCRPADPVRHPEEAGTEVPAHGISSAAERVQLDSGNVAFRAGEYENALRHYQAATEAGPGNLSGWFGVYMAYQALGDSEAADSALERARRQVPGTSIMPAPTDSFHR